MDENKNAPVHGEAENAFEALYVGCKIIKARPMSKDEFYSCIKDQPYEGGDAEGYFVKYPDGYESWSPKETFENAYRLITKGEVEMINS